MDILEIAPNNEPKQMKLQVLLLCICDKHDI
jgi:hypothetical protein